MMSSDATTPGCGSGTSETVAKAAWNAPVARFTPVVGVTRNNINTGVDGSTCAISSKLGS